MNKDWDCDIIATIWAGVSLLIAVITANAAHPF